MTTTHLLQAGDDNVVLITHAGSDVGYQLARELLQSGRKVAVASRLATDLPRILHGYDSDQVLAVAADLTDSAQLEQVLARTERRLDWIAAVIDTRQMCSTTC